MELITPLRDRILEQIEEIRNTPDYRDLELEWELLHPSWGLEDGPIDTTIDSFVDKAERVVEAVMEVVVPAIEQVRANCDPKTAWHFRHSALIAIANNFPILARFFATNVLHDSIASEIGGRHRPGSFEAWLDAHFNDDSGIGAFARMAIPDESWPVGSGDFKTYLNYLVSEGADEHAIVFFTKAWEAFTRESRLGLGGEVLDDSIEPELFGTATQVLAAMRELGDEDREEFLLDVGISDPANVDEEEFTKQWLSYFFRNDAQMSPPVAEAVTRRVLEIRDFLDRYLDRLRIDGWAREVGEASMMEFDLALLSVLSQTPMEQFPRGPEGEIEYEAVTAVAMKLRGGPPGE